MNEYYLFVLGKDFDVINIGAWPTLEAAQAGNGTGTQSAWIVRFTMDGWQLKTWTLAYFNVRTDDHPAVMSWTVVKYS